MVVNTSNTPLATNKGAAISLDRDRMPTKMNGDDDNKYIADDHMSESTKSCWLCWTTMLSWGSCPRPAAMVIVLTWCSQRGASCPVLPTVSSSPMFRNLLWARQARPHGAHPDGQSASCWFYGTEHREGQPLAIWKNHRCSFDPHDSTWTLTKGRMFSARWVLRQGIAHLWLVLSLLSIQCVDRVLSQTDSEVVYARLGDSTASSSWPCGSEADTACSTLQLALTNESRYPSLGTTTVVLLPSSYDRILAPELLSNLSNVLFNATQAGQLNLSAYRDFLSRPWIDVVNCSNVQISNFNVSMEGFNGSAAVRLRDCYNVSVVSSTFSSPALNTRALRVVNAWPLRLFDNEFRGASVLPSAPGLLAIYNLSSVMVSYTCDSTTCQTNPHPPPLEGYAYDTECCSSPAVLSGESVTMAVDKCQFLGLGIGPKYETYYRVMWEEAVTLHVETFFVHNVSITVKNCTFERNTSPYDANMKVFVGNGTRYGTMLVVDNLFKDNWCYIGGAMFYRAEIGAEYNQILIKNSTFFNNTAYIEGGAVAVSVFSITNTATVEDCLFIRNQGGPLSGVGQVGGAMSVICTSTTAQTAELPVAEQRMSLASFTRTNFNSNYAVYGSALFTRGVYAKLLDM